MQFIEILKTIVLGIIQGITEWLPISSTGHMILADTFLQLNQPKDFMDMFFVVIQLGSILAVVVLYFNKLNPFALHLPAVGKGAGRCAAGRRHRSAGRRLGHRAFLHPGRHRHRPHLLRYPVHPAGTPQPHCKAAHPLL